MCNEIVVGPILWAPLNFSMIWQGLPVSFVFGYWIKYRYVEWWNKYNYITSTALLSGIAFSIIIQFVGLTNRGITVSRVLQRTVMVLLLTTYHSSPNGGAQRSI